MTVRQDIIEYAEKNPGFYSYQIVGHLRRKRKTVNPANVTALLKKMTEGGNPELIRAPEGGTREVYRYWRAGR